MIDKIDITSLKTISIEQFDIIKDICEYNDIISFSDFINICMLIFGNEVIYLQSNNGKYYLSLNELKDYTTETSISILHKNLIVELFNKYFYIIERMIDSKHNILITSNYNYIKMNKWHEK